MFNGTFNDLGKRVSAKTLFHLRKLLVMSCGDTLKHHSSSARIYNTWTTALTFYYHIINSNKSPKMQPLKFGWFFTWMKILSFIIIHLHSLISYSQGRKSVFFLVFWFGVLFVWCSFTVKRLKLYGSFVTTWHYKHFHWEDFIRNTCTENGEWKRKTLISSTEKHAITWGGKKTNIKYMVKTLNISLDWHILCLSVNTAQTKKPLSKGHKGVRLLTCKGTSRANLKRWWLSTINQHSPMLHPDLVRFPQVHFNSSYSGSFVLEESYTHQGGCQVAEMITQQTKKPKQLLHSAEDGTVNWISCPLTPWLLSGIENIHPHRVQRRNRNHKS